jgi:hypothetical protein
MSSAFVKEQDDQWLEDVSPTVQALVTFLTRENNGIRVYEQKTALDSEGREIHVMSNGLSYLKDSNGKWQVLLA